VKNEPVENNAYKEGSGDGWESDDSVKSTRYIDVRADISTEDRTNDEEDVSVESSPHDDDEGKYYREDKNILIYSNTSPDLEKIFNIYVLENVSEEKVIKQRP
jgi:hypothetical protein